jgi:protease IV
MRTWARKSLPLSMLVATCLVPALTGWGQTAPAPDVAAVVPAPPAVIAHVRLFGAVHESPPEQVLFPQAGRKTLMDWLKRLARIRTDADVVAVALEIDSPSLSWAQAHELSDAIERLSQVKPVYAYLSGGGALSYLVAQASSEVAMERTGTLQLVGLGAELLFFRGALDHLRLQPQMIQVGRYKGAAEPLTDREPSPEMLETYTRVLDDLYSQLCESIAIHRGMGMDDVRAAIDVGPLSAEQAKALGLVDVLVEKVDWDSRVSDQVEARTGPATWKRDYGRATSQAVDLANPFALFKLLLGGAGGAAVQEPSIAIVHASGMITSGRSGEGVLGQPVVGARTLVKCFREVADDDRIKAVVFRIDSPGGSALASELIYQEVRRCAEKKPVIASISQMGASGGYYIAVGARTILADPPAIVGSIGVVGGKIAVSGMTEWMGITRHEMTRGRNAGLQMSRPWNEREQDVIRKLCQEIYKVFVQRVTESRGERIRDIDAVAQGRIFTARAAAANGLIDNEGGFNEAVKAAQHAAGLTACHYVVLPRPKTLMDVLAGNGGVSMGLEPVENLLTRRLMQGSAGLRYLAALADLFSEDSVLAVVPCYFRVEP